LDLKYIVSQLFTICHFLLYNFAPDNTQDQHNDS